MPPKNRLTPPTLSLESINIPRQVCVSSEGDNILITPPQNVLEASYAARQKLCEKLCPLTAYEPAIKVCNKGLSKLNPTQIRIINPVLLDATIRDNLAEDIPEGQWNRPLFVALLAACTAGIVPEMNKAPTKSPIDPEPIQPELTLAAKSSETTDPDTDTPTYPWQDLYETK
jgi:hypothetical protein